MPELPEVETTLRGIEPSLRDQRIVEIIVRNPSLRWPVPDAVQQACGQRVSDCWRRAKYLLVEIESGGGLLMHLGMSGSMRICPADDAPRKHDHVDIVMEGGHCIRFNDPRRFGKTSHLYTATLARPRLCFFFSSFFFCDADQLYC